MTTVPLGVGPRVDQVMDSATDRVTTRRIRGTNRHVATRVQARVSVGVELVVSSTVLQRIGAVSLAQVKRSTFRIIARRAAGRATLVSPRARLLGIDAPCRTVRRIALQRVIRAGIGVVALADVRWTSPGLSRWNRRVAELAAVDDAITAHDGGAIGVIG